MQPIITHRDAKKILQKKTPISLDLGKSSTQVQYDEHSIIIGEQKIPLTEFEDCKEDWCYILKNNTVEKVQFYSADNGYYYKLLPTADWPTFTISSARMHRSTNITPRESAKIMVDSIAPIKGRVLDTCCGLGYTATFASKNATEVHTFEKYPESIELCKINPYSQELFTNKKIQLHNQEIEIAITTFHNQYFDRIIHDPPTPTLAPALYGLEFYTQLYQKLKQNGKLYHYTPNPGKMTGGEIYTQIMKLLEKAGFKNIKYDEKASGIIADK